MKKKKVTAWIEIILSIFMFSMAFKVYSYSDYINKQFVENGTEISNIKSVGGQTLEEAFYENVGPIYNSFGSLTTLIGIIFSTLFIYIGVITLVKSIYSFSEFKKNDENQGV